MLQAMNIPDAEAAVDKEWEKLGKLPASQMTQVKGKSEVIQEAQKTKNSPCCNPDGNLSSQECGVRTTISEIQRPNRAPGGHCER